jgi:hypothetical protein
LDELLKVDHAIKYLEAISTLMSMGIVYSSCCLFQKQPPITYIMPSQAAFPTDYRGTHPVRVYVIKPIGMMASSE